MSLLLLFAQVAGPALEERGSSSADAAASFRIVPRCDRGAEGEEIVVCGRRDEAEPYRLPIRPDGFDKNGHIPSVSRERHRLYEVGDTGLYSCSNVGPGGYTGCAFKDFKAKVEQQGK
jgi:hypothetical protein